MRTRVEWAVRIAQLIVVGGIFVAVILAIFQDVEPPNALIWALALYVAVHAVFGWRTYERGDENG